jgi:fructose-1,6-bisphosphatase
VLSKYQVDKFQKVAERMAQINSTINEERKELAKDRIANKKEEEKPEADVFAGDKFVDLPVNDKLK